MDDPKPKFAKEELVQIKQKVQPNSFGIVVDVAQHQMPGDGGWYAFIYHILTPGGDVVEISESSILKIHTSSSAATK